MSARRWSIAAIALLATVAVAATALAADRSAELTEDAPLFTWTGAKTTAIAPLFYGLVGQPCTKTPVGYCDETLVHVTLPEDADRGSISVSIAGDGDDDLDLYLYSSDADGTTGDQLKYSNNAGTGGETVGYNLTESGWYLVKVVYFDVSDSAYTGRVELFLPTGTKIEPTPTPTPTPEPTATATATPAAPAVQTAAPPPAPEITGVRLRRRSVTGRLRCEVACAAQLNAVSGRRRLGRINVRLGAGDTAEFRVPIKRPSRNLRLRAHVLDASGRMTTLTLRAA